ncbi:class I glutamine amidotransferase-like protein [Aulographum hederae CBS 113979]|uniref:Class I glutamine amidotransferase-like protein n=1 Tax=Aulographum hederae CBS 113979 TaxID=1176131 RepID=A0A6G1H314_9PEZI|nr:class I glutamine amidotransferase-like protein [Aulographum hederae CBS 113979]
MSAVQDGSSEPIQVLYALHEGFDTLDFAGPFEAMWHAKHDIKDASTRAFEITTCSPKGSVTSTQGMLMKTDLDIATATDDLKEYDVLVIPGGGTDAILKDNSQPQSLIKAFAALQQSDSTKERTLLSICTGSLLLAQAGVLQGLSATTHPDHYTKLEILCKDAARNGELAQTDVMEERYVVNNARFELGENIDENPFILSKRPDGRRKSIARKGSNAWKESNKRRESNARRASLRLGGLRVITAGGIMAGVDATLYLIAAMVSTESAEEVARLLQFQWQKGVTVDGIDV